MTGTIKCDYSEIEWSVKKFVSPTILGLHRSSCRKDGILEGCHCKAFEEGECRLWGFNIDGDMTGERTTLNDETTLTQSKSLPPTIISSLHRSSWRKAAMDGCHMDASQGSDGMFWFICDCWCVPDVIVFSICVVSIEPKFSSSGCIGFTPRSCSCSDAYNVFNSLDTVLASANFKSTCFWREASSSMALGSPLGENPLDKERPFPVLVERETTVTKASAVVSSTKIVATEILFITPLE